MFVGGTVTLGGVGQGESARDQRIAQLRRLAQTVDVIDRSAFLDVLCVYCSVADGTIVMQEAEAQGDVIRYEVGIRSGGVCSLVEQAVFESELPRAPLTVIRAFSAGPADSVECLAHRSGWFQGTTRCELYPEVTSSRWPEWSDKAVIRHGRQSHTGAAVRAIARLALADETSWGITHGEATQRALGGGSAASSRDPAEG